MTAEATTSGAPRVFGKADQRARAGERTLVGDSTVVSNLRKSLADPYRRRQLEELLAGDSQSPWRALGPTVVDKGELMASKPWVSGRVNGIAVEGQRVYVASSNGGVWRSLDGGATWESTMEPRFDPDLKAFEEDPTGVFKQTLGVFNGSDSLACGAIALVAGDDADGKADRIYVGTGEGYTFHDSYFGVGPIVSMDGGRSWALDVDPESGHALAVGRFDKEINTQVGAGFFEMAVHPAEQQAANSKDLVIAATTVGLFRREAGPVRWAELALGGQTGRKVTSVVAGLENGRKVFYAALAIGETYRVENNIATLLGRLDASKDQERVSLAAHGDIVYALAWRTENRESVVTVYRLGGSTWRPVTFVEPAGPDWKAQGTYNLAITVDPQDPNFIYLGLARQSQTDLRGHEVHCGALYRCAVSNRAGLSMTMAPIGRTVHADIHCLTFDSGSEPGLWVGCDGGVFHAEKPKTGRASRLFEQRNDGLCTMTMEYLGQHPKEADTLYCGSQDNGCLKYLPKKAGERPDWKSEHAWESVHGGDTGAVLVNWHDPSKVLISASRNKLFRRIGSSEWNEVSVPCDPSNPKTEFYPPLASPPATDRVAFGWDQVWISEEFGGQWQVIGSATDAGFRSLEFASADKLYGGTRDGAVYRFDRTGTSWAETRLEDHGVEAPVTGIAVDPADPTGASFYVTLGGIGDHHRVYRYHGEEKDKKKRWESRSGEGGTSLLPVQHNVIVVHPDDPRKLYVGADLGVWHSEDRGASWKAFSLGLPDAAVLDLKIWPPAGSTSTDQRRLRAATHGRGVFERFLDASPSPKASVVLIIDKSGSMKDHGYLEPVQSEAACFVDKMGKGDSVGIVEFDDTPRVIFPPGGPSVTEIVDQSTRDAAAGAIDEITAGGRTNMSAAISLGMSMFSANAEGHRAMVLLSDGEWNEGENPTLGLPDIPIHTIALGPHDQQEVLKQIAGERGTFHMSPTAAELAEVYFEIVEKARIARVLVNESRDARSNEPMLIPADIPAKAAPEALFSVSWTDHSVTYTGSEPRSGQVRVRVRKPNGDWLTTGKLGRAFVGLRLPNPEAAKRYEVELLYGGGTADVLACTVGVFVSPWTSG